ncbi:ATP-binding protein [Neobacillus sp. Marseille-QA0830]
MRNAVTVPIGEGQCLVLACDNSGGIGMRQNDVVHVPYETVGYYAFRVASMECMAAGGKIISVVLHNFCGNEPWGELVKGIRAGLSELGLSEVPVTGSTESNFLLSQSAIGLVVIGKRPLAKDTQALASDGLNLAVFGMPLVGNEVMEQKDQVAPLGMFRQVCTLSDVVTWPVGSKGVLHELRQMFPHEIIEKESVITGVDILKSSGPATCFIAAFPESQAEFMKQLSKELFHSVRIMRK